MIARLLASCLGAALTITGALLLVQEAAIQPARAFLQQPEAPKLQQEYAQRGAALQALSSVPAWSENLVLAKLALLSGTAAPSPSDLQQTSKDLAHLSPLNGRAWCNLADQAIRKRGLLRDGERYLEMCFEAAPREASLIDVRLPLCLLIWGQLTPPLRAAALRDISSALADEAYAYVMVGRLAASAVHLVPERAELLRTMVEQHARSSLASYDEMVRRMSK